MVYQLDTPGLEDQAVTTEKIDTAAVTLSQAASSLTNALVPVKGIIMFSGTAAEVPANWSLCDGNNGTPDLRNQFVIAADNFNDQGSPAPNRWETSITGTGRATGGSKDAIVVSHNHTLTDDGHTHSITQTDHTHTEQYNTPSSGQDQAGSGSGDNDFTSTRDSGGAQANITIDDATTGITIDSAGSSGNNANLPPYFAIAFIMRVT